jgi:hypothetical protein
MTALRYTPVVVATLMLALVLCSRADAQIGWTEAQCRKVYGQGIVPPKHPDSISYTSGQLTVITHANDKGTIDYVAYVKLKTGESFTQAEIQKLLRKNVGTLEWRAEKPIGLSLKWTGYNTQGQAVLVALYDDSTSPAELLIATQESLRR